MDMKNGIRLLQLLDTRQEKALPVKEIASQWEKKYKVPITTRTVQRYVKELRADGKKSAFKEIGLLELAGQEEGKKKFRTDPKYYLRTSEVANWFVTEETALSLLLTRQLMARSFGSLGEASRQKIDDMADRIANASDRTQRIRQRLRIVPDGIGRLPAKVDNKILKAAVDAIGASRKLRLTYTNAKGVTSEKVLTVLGLVAKDGTIYLVGAMGQKPAPRHYALQRITKATLSFEDAVERPDFNLDDYIDATHQFSHVLDETAPALKLRLRVSPEAIYHFEERKLSEDQDIAPPKGREEWFTVKATVPDTWLLVPFLLSMGPWIEVIAPEHVRKETGIRLVRAAAHYQS